MYLDIVSGKAMAVLEFRYKLADEFLRACVDIRTVKRRKSLLYQHVKRLHNILKIQAALQAVAF